MNLIKGQLYRIKDEVKIKVTQNPVKYVGVDDYKSETYHNFYDAKTGLYHWLDPDKVEQVTQ